MEQIGLSEREVKNRKSRNSSATSIPIQRKNNDYERRMKTNMKKAIALLIAIVLLTSIPTNIFAVDLSYVDYDYSKNKIAGSKVGEVVIDKKI